VTVLEGADWVGGKSRRREIDGQRVDTGPALVTFPGVWHELLARYDELGLRASGPDDPPATEIETAAAVAVFFAMLGVLGCLTYVAVKHRICCPKKDLSVPATPADVQMTDIKITTSAA
jgi:hypothetical protein